MSYSLNGSSRRRRPWLRYIFIVLGSIVVMIALAAFAGKRYYDANLQAVNNNTQTKTVAIDPGMSLPQIADILKQNGVIRDARVFQWYVTLEGAAKYLQSGTYDVSPSQTTPQIVAQLTHGKVASQLITILPGQRLDQIRASLINQGFAESEVDAALNVAQYESLPLLADKPKGNNLEGYLYPDSFQRTATTTATEIITQSLRQMNAQLTPNIRAGFTAQGLTVYQGIILASIVEQEVTHQSDRAQAAQVFIKRTKIGMPLGSDVTAFYGSELAGRGKDVAYDTAYNTRIRTGMPPTPISNVSKSSLEAVARPAVTDWLFFVAGDNGTTYFSRTVEEHEALTKMHCKKLCQ
jgi:UPF0755 protein